MQSMIRFCLFGNYDKFNTSNLDFYMRNIEFFVKRGYKPATTNELQLQPNGQARMLVMPFFSNETGAVVAITSNSINFQKVVNDIIVGIETLNEAFENEYSDWINTFIADASIVSNRLALNCEILQAGTTLEMPIQSSFFDSVNKAEMSVRNVAREVVEKEESNIIIDKYVNVQGGFTKYLYDINTVVENQMFRFNDNNIKKMYEAYTNVALEIERGLK